MAFWGVEVLPGMPYIHRSDNGRGRLHLSQATLGTGSSDKKITVQCKVGDKKPVYLCSLLPEKLENCALNLEFEEDDEVTFSIIGSHSVHLSGFFYGVNEDQDNLENGYGFDPYEEDIMGMDSKDEDDSMDYDSEDEDEDDDDDEKFSDDDFGIYPPLHIPSSGEIVDTEKPTNDNGMSKCAKKKTQSSMPDDDKNLDRQIVPKAGNGVLISESEDEDGFPISKCESKSDISKFESTLGGTKDERTGVKTHKKSEKTDAAPGKKFKRKSNAVDPDEKPARKKEKKKKKQEENAPTPSAKKNLTDEIGSVLKKKEKAQAKSSQVRTFPNGLVIEELAMGKPDGKRASPGKKVSVRYIGKLKKNDKIFDSNIGKAPFKFRLGIGQVIKGWDVGVNGMRIGDKRRLTIPPDMGYGVKGCGAAIPPNSWLLFDVELVDVN